MPDYRALYIKALKEWDDDICKKCKHDHKCEAQKCEGYEFGSRGDVNGKKANFLWTCEDFNYGTCRMLEKTPCNGCMENNFSGFELKEDAIP